MFIWSLNLFCQNSNCICLFGLWNYLVFEIIWSLKLFGLWNYLVFEIIWSLKLFGLWIYLVIIYTIYNTFPHIEILLMMMIRYPMVVKQPDFRYRFRLSKNRYFLPFEVPLRRHLRSLHRHSGDILGTKKELPEIRWCQNNWVLRAFQILNWICLLLDFCDILETKRTTEDLLVAKN